MKKTDSLAAAAPQKGDAFRVDPRIFAQFLIEEGVEAVFIEYSGKACSARQLSPEESPVSDVKAALLALGEKTRACALCPELARTRTNVVFGSGNVNADLMFVGEAPGRDEDLQGLPFVGRAGQLLTKIIESIELTRKDVFIANTLKCRPPGNRPPEPGEIQNCSSYLSEQIRLIQPKILCALGTHAAQSLLKTTEPISKLRGRFHDYGGGIKLMCTFHPAYLLRNPGEKRKVWDDMKAIKKELAGC